MTGWSRRWAGPTRRASAGRPGSSAWRCCWTKHRRRRGHEVEFGFRGKLGQRLKSAARQHARFAVLLGEDELAADQVVLRDLDRGEQEIVARGAVANRLARAA